MDLEKKKRGSKTYHMQNYLMPSQLHQVDNMTTHVHNHFPIEDLPQIFGLHHCATAAADAYMASDIMDRVYKN